METVRKPLQGVANIVRFNWPFYLFIVFLCVGALLSLNFVEENYRVWINFILFKGGFLVLLSLGISAYVYDFSGLYSLKFLNAEKRDSSWLNIHAGFDESSALIQSKFAPSSLRVFDFYDPERHTEASIQRARKAYPPFKGTEKISSDSLPCGDKTVSTIVLFLAAHEIRDEQERIVFFGELKRVLKEGGKIFVVEHLRDIPNFVAYTLGVFHFLTKKSWMTAFAQANLKFERQERLNPFIRLFVIS